MIRNFLPTARALAEVKRFIDSRSDVELARLMNNLGGHDLRTLRNAFASR